MNHARHRTRKVVSFVAWVAACNGACASALASDALFEQFRSPPSEAKPRVWWHWINGNVSQEAIRRDLEWMKRVGVGGATLVETSFFEPRVVDKPLVYMAPEWRDAFQYSAELAAKLHLEFGIDSSPGWSLTGGPWVEPAHAMKKLVWSRTIVRGGQRFRGRLSAPPMTSGPFQNLQHDYFPFETKLERLPTFYADAAVVAWRLPDGAQDVARATVTAAAEYLDAALLDDGDVAQGVSIPIENDKAVVRFFFDKPQTIRSAVLATPGFAPIAAQLESRSADGSYRPVTVMAASEGQTTVSFKPVTAQEFRFTLVVALPQEKFLSVLNYWPSPGADLSPMAKFLPPAPTKRFTVSELSLHAEGRVHEFERKAGFAIADDYYALDTPAEAANLSVPSGDVLDVSDRMAPDGSFDWNAPPGRWVVLRMGYSLTGKTNHVAMKEATGLEVDKLNRRYVQRYMQNYLGSYASFLPPSLMGVHGLTTLTVDSTEARAQNWTDDMLAQFQRLRGYDPRPWLPALTGVVVGSAARSDKFLWDFRRTIAQLTVESHYSEIAASAHAHGLKHYGEAQELGRHVLGDDLEMRRYADIPTGAMWTSYPADKPALPDFAYDCRGAASVAHLYGQNLAAAEAFTGALEPWAFAPRDLKPVADLVFALGINRIVIHTSPHQPSEQAPGLTLGFFGQSFNRQETWAEEAGPWLSYLARSSFLLQQGRFAADVAYFYGEEGPVNAQPKIGRSKDTPDGYAFDFINADALLHLVEVRDGHLTTPSGMRYRVLQLGGTSERMTLPVLRRLRMLVERGAIVVGRPPVESPSLADDDSEFQRIRAQLWGSDSAGARVGRGRVYGRGTVEEALVAEGLMPDVTYSRPRTDTNVMFVHRALPDGEIYFLTNRMARKESLEVSFRINGRTPQVWNAETGTSAPASFRTEKGRTIVPLELAANEAVFVVFRQPAAVSARTVPQPVSETLHELPGPWRVDFPAGRGAPGAITLDRLASWSANADRGVKYFSGTARYTATLDAPPEWFKLGRRLLIDFGEVREVARVVVNGTSLGTLWKPPFLVDVTEALRAGGNVLELHVTNLWVNRLIGDRQPGAVRYTFTAEPAYLLDAPLRDSGLLGPVSVKAVTLRQSQVTTLLERAN